MAEKPVGANRVIRQTDRDRQLLVGVSKGIKPLNKRNKRPSISFVYVIFPAVRLVWCIELGQVKNWKMSSALLLQFLSRNCMILMYKTAVCIR